ncbi:MAG: SufD family Fe-S cluster assembly protein, partial [Patescibacteria group bacterium]
VMPDLIPSGKPVGVNRHPVHQEDDGSRVGARDDEQHVEVTQYEEHLVEGHLVREVRFRVEEGTSCSMSSVYRAHEKDADLEVRFFVTLEKNATFSLDIASFLLGERSKSDVRVFLVLNEGSRATVRQLTRAEASSSIVHEEIRGLAIGEYAYASFIPELELLHDDVLATHAASIVCVDEKRIAYLLARGVSREDAVGCLAQAFLQSTVSSRTE